MLVRTLVKVEWDKGKSVRENFKTKVHLIKIYVFISITSRGSQSKAMKPFLEGNETLSKSNSCVKLTDI